LFTTTWFADRAKQFAGHAHRLVRHRVCDVMSMALGKWRRLPLGKTCLA
jgi:hypothetical protein